MRSACGRAVVTGLLALATVAQAVATDSVIVKKARKPYEGTVIRDDALKVVLSVGDATSEFALCGR